MKEILLKMSRPILRLFTFIFGKYKQGFFTEIFKAFEKEDKAFGSYHFRPQFSASMSTESDTGNYPKTAIVLQGPILIENDFTFETIKIYNKHFPDALIILSTWEDEDAKYLERFKRLDYLNIVLNKKPACVGISHINYQIFSSGNGIKLAKDMGIKYVIKTRTDQRMYAPNVLNYLYNLTEVFPVKKSFQQKRRLVGMSLNTFKYRIYGISDMLIYGHIDDMLSYWTPEFDNRLFDLSDGKANTLRKYSRLRLCEVYLMTKFLEKIGINLRWTLRDSWRIFADHFCVVDKEQLDLIWPKYNRCEYPNMKYDFKLNFKCELTFRDWLNIYCDVKNFIINEDILDIEQ